jgi:electron transfer flavoprotein beta subunit
MEQGGRTGAMKILVLLKMVPDVVEELEVAGDGISLSREFLRLIVNERDEYALEQALILKERHQATVIVVAPEAPEVDDVLFTALARGADRAVKIAGLDEGTGSRASAAAVAAALPAVAGLLPVDLILTGCQAIDDLDGLVGPFVAQEMGFPYVGIVTGLDVDARGIACCSREYPGGVRGSFEIDLPAVVGIQGAEKPPRYVPIAKVRAAMAAGKIEVVSAPGPAEGPSVGVVGMKRPEVAERAEMITGDLDEIAARVCEILAGRGLL